MITRIIGNLGERRRYLPTLALVLFCVSVTACAPKVVETRAGRKPAEDVLILTGAGMVSMRRGDPKYEQTWLNVVGVYSRALKEKMQEAGVNAELHIKKERAEDPEAVLARLVAAEPKDALVQVTVTHVHNSNENTVYLEAEFMPLVFERLENGQRRVVPQSGPQKRYPLMSTTGKDMRDTSLSGLAAEFVKELRAQGHVK